MKGSSLSALVLLAVLAPGTSPWANSATRVSQATVDPLVIRLGHHHARVAALGAMPRLIQSAAGQNRTAHPATREVAELRIEFDPKRAVAGRKVKIVVLARDAAGKASDADVKIDSDLGELGPLVRLDEGHYRATLDVPSVLHTERSIFVLARAGIVSANASVPLAPGPLASISVKGPDVLTADGSTTGLLAVTLLDAYGNPAEEVPVAEASHAELGAAAHAGQGFWEFAYRPRPLARDSQDVVRVRAGALTGTRTVKLIASPAPFSLAPKGGIVLRSGEVWPVVGVEASAWTHLGGQQVGLVLEGSWWRVHSAGPVQASGSSIDFTGEQSYLPLTASLAWRRPVGSLAMVWLSLGGGVGRVSSTARLAGQPELSESSWAPVASAAISGGLRAWGGFAFAEVRSAWIGDPHLATLSGSVVPVFLQLGYRFDAG